MTTGNDADRLREVVRLGVDMRRAQRLYFRAPGGTAEKADALQVALAAERAFDQYVATIRAPALDLGGEDGAGG